MLAATTPIPHDLIRLKGRKAYLAQHAGQRAATLSRARFTFVVAGTQSGKTSYGPWWLAKEIKERGAGDYIAATATYDLFKLKMLPEMRRVFCSLLPGWEWQASDRVIWRKEDNTRIILRSANVPEAMESATAKGAWLDECGQDTFRLESWEAVQRRIALHQGRVLGTTTPYNMGWLKTEVYDRWRAGDPNYKVIQFESTMNPSFPMAEYERARATLPTWKFKMFYQGQFTRPAGMIYDCFDEDIHVIDPIPLPPELPRYVGIDPGAVHYAAVFLAHDPAKNVYYLYREYLEGGRTTPQHAEALHGLTTAENVIVWAGGAKSEIQQRLDLQAAGVPVIEPAIIDVEAGISRVYELLKTNRLFVFRNCRGVLDELGTYARELDDMGQPTERIKDKASFHRLDALRYAVQHIGGYWYMS